MSYQILTRYLPIFITLFLIFTPNAFAYLDPGSGSLILQAIIASIAGGIIAIKTIWRRIINRKDRDSIISDDSERDDTGK